MSDKVVDTFSTVNLLEKKMLIGENLEMLNVEIKTIKSLLSKSNYYCVLTN